MRWVEIEYALVSCVFLFPLVWRLLAYRAFLSLPLSFHSFFGIHLLYPFSIPIPFLFVFVILLDAFTPLTNTTNLRTNLPPPPGLTTPHPLIPPVLPPTPADVIPTCFWIMESEIHRMGVQNLKIPLRGKIKVEAHGGIQTGRVLLYQRELEGPWWWKRMATQNA